MARDTAAYFLVEILLLDSTSRIEMCLYVGQRSYWCTVEKGKSPKKENHNKYLICLHKALHQACNVEWIIERGADGFIQTDIVKIIYVAIQSM